MSDTTLPAATSPVGAKRLVSLRVRLALAIAVCIGVTFIGASWLALGMAQRALAADVRAVAERTAAQAAQALAALPAAAPRDALDATLRELDAAVAEIETLSYVRQDAGGLTVLATTGRQPAAAALDLAARAIAGQRLEVLDTGDAVRIAAPVRRPGEPPAAVVVLADLGTVLGLQQRAMRAVIGFGLLSILALVMIVDLLAWPMVHRPVQELRRTIARVTAGDVSARAPVGRRDELGEVFRGLNEMLARLENLNDSMQARVRDATVELQQRNQQLVDSYHRLFGLREQLASAEQLASVGQTAANVAHQVGTPLNLISGYVQLLREELGPNSPHEPRLTIIEEQIGKVTSTVRTLLDRSRSTGRKTRTTAADLVGRVCEVMRPNLEAAGIRLDVAPAESDVPILVDATNLELSLLNLMTNAVDAMPEGGSLRVRVTEAHPGRVAIEIADTGHGIPAELLPRIFDPWVSTKKPGRGTGLGLAIARDVVSAHGGTIAVRSEVGRGTTFTIELPAGSVHEAGRPVS